MKKSVIIGMGDISAIHIAACNGASNTINLVAVCDIDPATQKKAPDGIAFYTDYKIMIKETTPDCVHICLPHYLHFPVAKDVAAMGCNVFCEKPLAMSVAEAQAFAALEKQYPNQCFAVCLQNRFNETSLQLKKILESNKYGRIIGAKGLVPWLRPKAYYDIKPWRGTIKEAGGGTMMNQSIHTLDLLYYFCGPVKSLQASVSKILDYGIEVEDTVSASIQFENGANGLFWATNANFANESTQLTISTEKACFNIENGQLTMQEAGDSKTVICEDKRMPGSKFYYGASHADLIHNFYNSLENNTGVYTAASDGVMSIRLIDAIIRSSKTKTRINIA